MDGKCNSLGQNWEPQNWMLHTQNISERQTTSAPEVFHFYSVPFDGRAKNDPCNCRKVPKNSHGFLMFPVFFPHWSHGPADNPVTQQARAPDSWAAENRLGLLWQVGDHNKGGWLWWMIFPPLLLWKINDQVLIHPHISHIPIKIHPKAWVSPMKPPVLDRNCFTLYLYSSAMLSPFGLYTCTYIYIIIIIYTYYIDRWW